MLIKIGSCVENVPEVWYKTTWLVLVAFLAKNPVAPLFLPLINAGELSVIVEFKFKYVYVWISYRMVSNIVESSEYSVFFNFRSYTLASPISRPEGLPCEDVLSENSLTWLVVPNPTLVEPKTLLSSSWFPKLTVTETFLFSFVSLGFSTSKFIVLIVSTSYPFT